MTELFIVTDYSDKGFALYGKDTKKYSEEIKDKYKGLWGPKRHGQGWFVRYGKTDEDSNPLIKKLLKVGAKKFTSEKYAAKIGKSDKDLKKAVEKKKEEYLKKKGVTKKAPKDKTKTKKKVASSAAKTKKAKKEIESFSPTKTKGYEAHQKEYQSIEKIMRKYKYDVIINEIADKVYKAQKIKLASDRESAYILKLSSLRILLESFYEKYGEPEEYDDRSQEITFSNVAKRMIPNLNHTYHVSMAAQLGDLIKWVYDNQDRANEARKFLEETIDDIDKRKEFPKIAKKAKAAKANPKKKTVSKKKVPAKTNKKPTTKKPAKKAEPKKEEKKTKKPANNAGTTKKEKTKGKPTPKSTVVELKAYAKEKGLKGYSKMKKDELLKLLKIK